MHAVQSDIQNMFVHVSTFKKEVHVHYMLFSYQTGYIM
jgi:hypothetical protein